MLQVNPRLSLAQFTSFPVKKSRLFTIPFLKTFVLPPCEIAFLIYFLLADFMKPGHDQYVRRHANGYFKLIFYKFYGLMLLKCAATQLFCFLFFFFPLSEHSLCVVGLASSHLAFKDEGGLTSVDFNVGKSDRSGIKVTGKRKKVIFLFDLFFFVCV